MTPAEALTRLGLDPAAPPDAAALRRAYLQAVKKHKPESDPQGFQEVRAAYELLQQIGEGAFFVPAPVVAPVTTAEPASPTTPATVEAPEVPPADDPGNGSAPAHLAPYLARIEAPEAVPWQRTQIAWEAYRAFRGDPAARELLLSLLPAQARNDITLVLREGAEAGDAFCLWRLLRFAPEAVSVAQLEAIERGPDEQLHLAALLARLDRGDVEQGLAALEKIVRAAAGQLPQRPLIRTLLEAVLRLEGVGKVGASHKARELLRGYLGSGGLPGDAATPHDAALYLVVTDLGACDFLPDGVRREIARGALEGNFTGVNPALTIAIGELGEKTMRSKLTRLSTTAPGLYRLLNSPQIQRSESRSGGFRWAWLMVPLLLSALRGLGNGCTEPSYQPVSAPMTAPVEFDVRPLLRAQTTALCADGKDPACEKLHELWSAVDSGRSCGDIEENLTELMKLAETPAMRGYIGNLSSQASSLCRR